MTSDFALHKHQLHVWRCDLRLLTLLRIDDALSDDELERAAAFVFERDRVRYRAGRWLLRALLARYLNQSVRQVRVLGAEHAKPHLVESNLRFSVSHCADVYVLAVCDSTEVGIDIELHREVSDAIQMAKMVFSPQELDSMLRLPEDEISPAFLRGWTRKEAYIKALGIGLGGADLTAITVGLDEGFRILKPIDGISSLHIAVRSFPDAEGYLATATHPAVTQIQMRNLDASDLASLRTASR